MMARIGAYERLEPMMHEVRIGIAQISSEPYAVEANRLLCENAIKSAIQRRPHLWSCRK